MNNLPSADIYDRIINKINYEHKLQALKKKMITNTCGLLLCLIVFIPVFARLHTEIIQSGLIQFILLIFTDFKMITTYFGDYIWSILNSVPVVSSSLALLILTLAFISLSKIFIYFLEMRNLLHVNYGYKNI
jgi:hypothetical protein